MNELTSDILFENLQAAVILVDQNGLIQRVNIAAETLFGQSRRTLLGAPIRGLIELEQLARCLDECLAQNAQYTLREVNIELAQSEVLVDIDLSMVRTNSKQAVLLELHSINRISRFMKDQNQLERQQSFRLMMRGLAHEIKNPLSGIRGAAQLLGRDKQAPDHQELTDILIKEADRLTRLVDRVMGSREQLNLQPVNIHQVLEHVADLVSVRCAGSIVINRDYDPALPEILADKEQLIQAVLNIVVNAQQAQTDSTPLHLALTTQFERFVTINQILHKRALKISISDNGPGVAAELREILFDPLITGRADGTGLGLSIAQEIVQRHNGIVQLDDGVTQTCFVIYLPYQEDNAEGEN